MKKGKAIAVSVNPDMIFEGAQVMHIHELLGLRVGRVKSINEKLKKIIFQEGFTNPFGECTSGVLISDLKTIVIEHEFDEGLGEAFDKPTIQIPLNYSEWKKVIENKLLDTDKDVYFTYSIIYSEWNDCRAIDTAIVENEKENDIYIGQLGEAIDFIQEYPDAIYELIKASGKTFNEIKNDQTA